jgi:RND superfamily putative drug exporter
MSGFLDRVGRWCAKHHWRTLGLWLVALVILVGVAGSVGGKPVDNFRLPGSDAQEAADVLQRNFHSESGASAYLVFRAPETSITDASWVHEVDATMARIARLPHVVGISDPYAPDAVSRDGMITRADVRYSREVIDIGREGYDELSDALTRTRDTGLQVEIGGPLALLEQSEGSTEWVGVLVAMVVLTLVFGSLLAMMLPIGVALAAVGIGQVLLTVLAGAVDVPSSTEQLVLMIGLGVALDYSLFIVSRYLDRVRGGEDVSVAAGHAAATAGVAVLFAGSTVIIAICGLALSGIWAVGMMGFGVALVVGVTVVAALTLLPALLGILARHANRSRFGVLRRSVRREYRGAQRWAAAVVRRPVMAMVSALVVLLVLASPVLALRLGQADAGTAPPSSSQRKAFDLLSDGYGPGFNGPLLIVADGDGVQGRNSLDGVSGAIAADAGVARVSAPRFNATRDVAVIEAFPTTAPHASETAELVKRLRTDVIPPNEPRGTRLLITGATAGNMDVADELQSRLPFVIATVTFVSFLLLVIAFRSLVVPLKAAIMNLLSIGVGYGVLVAVFQWGWAKELIGLSETVPIVSWVPLLMFAILFGLSMDYEVFLISSIREAHQRHGDNRRSVVEGLTSTARIISAAALIMLSVFGSFIAFPDTTVKMIGLGLAVSIFIDATIVRMVLVPASMILLGESNWWIPRWLDRILPRIDFEGSVPTIESVDTVPTPSSTPHDDRVPVGAGR